MIAQLTWTERQLAVVLSVVLTLVGLTMAAAARQALRPDFDEPVGGTTS